MNVNKKRLAEIFGVDPRTMNAGRRWAFLMHLVAEKAWKDFRLCTGDRMVCTKGEGHRNEKLRRELDNLRAAGESDLQQAQQSTNATVSPKHRLTGRNEELQRDGGGYRY